MWRGKSLVQIQVHDVDAEIAGASFADQRIHVGAIHVEQRAFGMQDVGDLVNLTFKHADRGRVGQHERRGFFIDQLFQFGEVDHAMRCWT